MEKCLAKTLAHAKRTAKLVVIMESRNAGPQELTRQARAKEIIREAMGAEWSGKIRTKKREQLVEWAWRHQTDLQDLIGFNGIIG